MWLIFFMAFFFNTLKEPNNLLYKSIALRSVDHDDRNKANDDVDIINEDGIVNGEDRDEKHDMDDDSPLFDDPLFPYQWHLVRFMFDLLV